MPTSSNEKTYFDLHVTGLGYVNRIREIKPRKGDAFLACEIAALNGPSNEPEYRYFDVRVSGADAQHLIRRCEEAVEAKRKVLIGFRLGDLWPDLFTHTKGRNQGKTGVSLKARLLFVSWIKVDGQLVYKAEAKAADHACREDAPASQEDAPKVDSPATDDADVRVPAMAASF
jgi:Protein of unknown function (DUF3577)